MFGSVFSDADRHGSPVRVFSGELSWDKAV